jgi:hypothetical protein
MNAVLLLTVVGPLSASFGDGAANGGDEGAAQSREFEEGSFSLGEVGRSATAKAELG